MTLTENTGFEELKRAFLNAVEYGKRSANSPKIMRIFRKGGNHVFHRVNTPDGIPVVYVFHVNGKRMVYDVLLVLQGSEGETFADYYFPTNEIVMIHSHAINRYMERHGFQGSVGECQKHIILNTEMQSIVCDEITDERKIYFDGGCFLGYQDGNIYHMKTFVMNRQLYPNQRMESLKSEKRKDALLALGVRPVLNPDYVTK